MTDDLLALRFEVPAAAAAPIAVALEGFGLAQSLAEVPGGTLWTVDQAIEIDYYTAKAIRDADPNAV